MQAGNESKNAKRMETVTLWQWEEKSGEEELGGREETANLLGHCWGAGATWESGIAGTPIDRRTCQYKWWLGLWNGIKKFGQMMLQFIETWLLTYLYL
jgi:hypothetical protein